MKSGLPTNYDLKDGVIATVEIRTVCGSIGK